MVVAFQAYRRPLDTATVFKYLGWVLTTLDDNWKAVVVNLWKVGSRWKWFSRILGWEREDPVPPESFIRW